MSVKDTRADICFLKELGTRGLGLGHQDLRNRPPSLACSGGNYSDSRISEVHLTNLPIANSPF